MLLNKCNDGNYVETGKNEIKKNYKINIEKLNVEKL